MERSTNQAERQVFRMTVIGISHTLRSRTGNTEAPEYDVDLRGTNGALFSFTTPDPPMMDAEFDLHVVSPGATHTCRPSKTSVLSGPYLDTCHEGEA